MKRNAIIISVLLFVAAHAGTVSSESASSEPQPDLRLLILQQQLQAVQMKKPVAVASENVKVDAIQDTWKGRSPSMEPRGACTETPVVVKITRQCGSLVKGSIKALGVTVPVVGSFENNFLYLSGNKTGAVSWIASIYGVYSAVNDDVTVQIFNFIKGGHVMNNVYDTGWKLTR